MIAGISEVIGDDRDYVLFDSFEGLPPATTNDGQSAMDWQANRDSANFFNNCTAEESFAHAAMKRANRKYTLVKGWFSETLHSYQFPHGIAILRLDGDWYDSTIVALEELFFQLNPGGIAIIDDYYTWDGCSRAVHDFLSKNGLSERIEQHRGICYIRRNSDSEKRI